ncbi:helix-turn-helix domain-containing protein [Thalassospira tepidiphila]|uniref:Phage repressor protein C with HTH and peptisase S24 domain n=1 Tax=Thalassospira tepidiphila TaxID=393657 RepID=A0ABX0WZ76_9PROT|nr:helix-turn-helix domain-containing protein [Thalassospira tepidiphila]NJB74593.1 phage repressor protein C with HTH and peptisase S24 domain [Thalassospira tepidiphila]
MQRAGLNESELARKVGLKPQTINSITRGITQRSRSMPEIAEALGVSLDWLLRGSGEPATNHDAFAMEDEPMTWPEPVMKEDLPIRGSVDGMSDGVKLTKHQGRDDIQGYTFRPRPLLGNRHAFAVYANGEAMAPRYLPGEVLWIVPGLPLKPRRNVLIEMNDGTAIVRQLVSFSSADIVVRTLTPDVESHLSRDDVRHVHTVAGSWDM